MSSFREATLEPQPLQSRLGRVKESPVSIERVVALLTPVFAAAAGWLSVEVATLVGVQIPRGDFTAIFITGAASALGAALKWLHGRSQWVRDIHGAEAFASAHGIPVAVLEDVLKAHEAQIIDGLVKVVHAPPSADALAKEIVRELWPARAAAGAAPETAVASS